MISSEEKIRMLILMTFLYYFKITGNLRVRFYGNRGMYLMIF